MRKLSILFWLCAYPIVYPTLLADVIVPVDVSRDTVRVRQTIRRANGELYARYVHKAAANVGSAVGKPAVGTPVYATGSQGVLTNPTNIENTTNPSITTQVISKTNQYRIQNGRGILTPNATLMRSAQNHANWMARRNSMQHTSQPIAENIARGQRNPNEVVRTWINSPGHRANMLNYRHTQIGVGVARSRNGQLFWCQQFK